MKAFKKNISNEEYPYIGYCAEKPTYKTPTVPQQKILDQMESGIWYETEDRDERGRCKDRIASCYALVAKGWLVYAKLGLKRNDGAIKEPLPEEILLHCILKKRTFSQPFVLFKKSASR